MRDLTARVEGPHLRLGGGQLGSYCLSNINSGQQNMGERVAGVRCGGTFGLAGRSTFGRFRPPAPAAPFIAPPLSPRSQYSNTLFQIASFHIFDISNFPPLPPSPLASYGDASVFPVCDDLSSEHVGRMPSDGKHHKDAPRGTVPCLPRSTHPAHSQSGTSPYPFATFALLPSPPLHLT